MTRTFVPVLLIVRFAFVLHRGCNCAPDVIYTRLSYLHVNFTLRPIYNAADISHSTSTETVADLGKTLHPRYSERSEWSVSICLHGLCPTLVYLEVYGPLELLWTLL